MHPEHGGPFNRTVVRSVPSEHGTLRWHFRPHDLLVLRVVRSGVVPTVSEDWVSSHRASMGCDCAPLGLCYDPATPHYYGQITGTDSGVESTWLVELDDTGAPLSSFADLRRR